LREVLFFGGGNLQILTARRADEVNLNTLQARTEVLEMLLDIVG
jgi:hypothetical protein